jgi:hypothetical protein
VAGRGTTPQGLGRSGEVVLAHRLREAALRKSQPDVKQEKRNTVAYLLNPLGFIRSTLKTRREAPKQGSEGAPDAWLEVAPAVAQGLHGIAAGDEIIVITWFHRARRDVLKLHPRWDKRLPHRRWAMEVGEAILAVGAGERVA